MSNNVPTCNQLHNGPVIHNKSICW